MLIPGLVRRLRRGGRAGRAAVVGVIAISVPGAATMPQIGGVAAGGTATAGVSRPCPTGLLAALYQASSEPCVAAFGPESYPELDRAGAALTARSVGPDGELLPQAQAAALAQRAQMAAAAPRISGNGGTWQVAGHGPLIADDPRYGSVNLLGLRDLAGRINDYAFDPIHRWVIASVGQGGVWYSKDKTLWRSIGDNLPTQSVGSVGFSTSQGGTIIVTTGNNVFGGGTTFAGVGVYRSLDYGATWQQATGVPDGVISFKVAVDPSNPDVVYAATGGGLFRSTDDAQSFVNVNLPVTAPGANPSCSGAPATKEGCALANMVTDVVVRTPGGVGGDKTGGAVVAAVGWRAGNKQNTSAAYPGGYPESPGNGLYVSPTGAADTFTKLDITASNFADGDQPNIGRIALGAAIGPAQDHGYLYALVQDATRFKGGTEALGIDIGSASTPVSTTYLKGVYASADFGKTWTRIATSTQFHFPSSGSATTGLACENPLGPYCPGVQAWYNEWIKPDPTRADASGVPTRMALGLEEMWENRLADAAVPQPLNAPTDFQVIGPYFSGNTCLFLNASVPMCPTTAGGGGGASTTHPDHHAGLWVPDPAPETGVTLLGGSDGGAYVQRVAGGAALSPTAWARGRNLGFNTLMPYNAAIAKDGTVWAGLQDNGEMRIDPKTGAWYETYGGDGTISQVDPDHSNIAYERTPSGAIRMTSDGGQTWTSNFGPSDTFQFVNPFAMDPNDSSHLFDAGYKVWEASGGTWAQVFDLGKAKSGAQNQMSWIDVRGKPTGPPLPSGPHTPDFKWTAGMTTVPGGAASTTGQHVPGTYEDKTFTIGPNDGDASMTIRISWTNQNLDWDLYVLRNDNGTEVPVASSTGSAPETSEQVVVPNPKPGNYIIRVENFAAAGTVDGTATFAQRPAGLNQPTDAAYVAFCGYCDALNTRPFDSGIATNVGGAAPGQRQTSDGWHFANAAGLPTRYITSIASDPADPSTVYVTLGGYSRRWLRVGVLGENPDPGKGHVFKSVDAGNTFTDISGDLPDTPAESTVSRNGQLVVATDVGVFISDGTGGGHYELLGGGLPAAPVLTVVLKPKASPTEPDTLVAATHGRGVYLYQFLPANKPPVKLPLPATGTAPPSPVPALLALLLVGLLGVGLELVRRRRISL
jgi:hypothetical protein